MPLAEETRLKNQTFIDWINAPGGSMIKHAVDAATDYTRIKVREDSFFDRIVPPIMISASDLDRQSDTPRPVVVIDKEADSPAARVIPFGSLPDSLYIMAARYRVHLARIATPRHMADVMDLATWNMDIRQVISDNSIKDLLTVQDNTFLSTVEEILVGPDLVVPQTGTVQWETIPGGITRDTLEDAFKILPRSPSRLEVNHVLSNNLTIREIMKFGRDEMGGDYSQDLIRNGKFSGEFMNAQWTVTIKQDIVPDDRLFFFAEPKFLGKNFVYEDTTMHIEREAFVIKFFAYKTMGGAVANYAACGAADFA